MWTGQKGGIALSGFPFNREARSLFSKLVTQTGFEEISGIPRVLCIHQTVEGAQVGPSNFTFRRGADVVKGQDIPDGFCAVLSGHIHRAQVLTYDLHQRPMAAPVIYPGSVERTSFAERTEEKGYFIVSISQTGDIKNCLANVSFIRLPARPMLSLVFEPTDTAIEHLGNQLASRLGELDPHSVVRIVLRGAKAEEARGVLSAAYLRQLAPTTMNITMALEREKMRNRS
jgi:DNA repair exonuclease SbcCD nuclease subunit